MKYVISGLVGFFLTLVLSLPLQYILKQREGKGAVGKARLKTQERSQSIQEELEVKVLPMIEGAGKPGLSEPKIKFMPQYPRYAALKQIEGYVTLKFSIAQDGSVQNLKVVESSPKLVFDEVAKDAVAKWTYASKEGIRSGSELSVRLNFNLNKSFASDQRISSSGI